MLLPEDCPADAQDPRQLLHRVEVKARLLHVGARPPPDHEGQRILLHPLWQILDAPFISVGALPSPNVGSLAPEAVTGPAASGAMLGSPGSLGSASSPPPQHFYFLSRFDSCATHARTLLPAALASVPFGIVSVRVRVQDSRNVRLIRQFSTERGSLSPCSL